jgi:hypothetical protein
MQKELTLSQGVPKSVTQLEADLKALKSDQKSLLQYIKNIPLTAVESIFKKSDLPPEALAVILESVRHVESNEDKAWSGDLLLSLSKAANFDMTLMFAEEDDKNLVRLICSGLRSADKTVCAEKA